MDAKTKKALDNLARMRDQEMLDEKFHITLSIRGLIESAEIHIDLG